MNAKSKLKVIYAEGVIEMNTTFAKVMQNPLSEEYALLQKTRQDFPTFAVRTRKIKPNPKKDTYKGLTYEYMKMYIKTHEPKETVQEVLDCFDDKILISKCHGQSLRYPTIKKWFLEKYPEVAKFGLVEQKNQTEDVNTQTEDVNTQTEDVNTHNVIPMNTVPQDTELSEAV